jgi:uncharacterized protein (DUF1330 family)
MRTRLLYPLGLAAFFALGYSVAHMQLPAAHAQGVAEKAAYLIASTKSLAPDKMGPYREAAGPLAKNAGMQMVAAGEAGRTIQVLEGKYPYEGRIAIERFRSMKALLDFWNSPGYQNAKKLREGLMETNFIIAVEAVD